MGGRWGEQGGLGGGGGGGRGAKAKVHSTFWVVDGVGGWWVVGGLGCVCMGSVGGVELGRLGSRIRGSGSS